MPEMQGTILFWLWRLYSRFPAQLSRLWNDFTSSRNIMKRDPVVKIPRLTPQRGLVTKLTNCKSIWWCSKAMTSPVIWMQTYNPISLEALLAEDLVSNNQYHQQYGHLLGGEGKRGKIDPICCPLASSFPRSLSPFVHTLFCSPETVSQLLSLQVNWDLGHRARTEWTSELPQCHK